MSNCLEEGKKKKEKKLLRDIKCQHTLINRCMQVSLTRAHTRTEVHSCAEVFCLRIRYIAAPLRLLLIVTRHNLGLKSCNKKTDLCTSSESRCLCFSLVFETATFTSPVLLSRPYYRHLHIKMHVRVSDFQGAGARSRPQLCSERACPRR